MILEVPDVFPNFKNEKGMSAYLTQWVIQKTPLRQSYLHIANERKTSHAQGHELKMMGVLAGACDHFFTRGNGQKHGLWIELKMPKRKPNALQLEFIANRIEEGYHAFWSDDLKHVITEIALFYQNS